MTPLSQSKKIAVVALGLFTVSISILFAFTQKSAILSGDLKAQLLGNEKVGIETQASEPSVIIGTDNKIVYSSPGFLSTLGYKEEDLKGQDLFQLINSGDAGTVASFITKIVQEKEELKNVGPFRIKDNEGQYKVYMANVKAVEKHGKVEQIVVTMKDITKSVDDMNEEKSTGKPIRAIKNDTEKKFVAEKGV